jgi:hypothetical protein
LRRISPGSPCRQSPPAAGPGSRTELVAQFFDGDAAKTALWFKTPNPLLGNLSPRDMIRYGRYDRLRRFVLDALDENAPEAHGTA